MDYYSFRQKFHILSQAKCSNPYISEVVLGISSYGKNHDLVDFLSKNSTLKSQKRIRSNEESRGKFVFIFMGSYMRIKLIALSFLLATVAVQAGQVKMPSLRELKNRLEKSRIASLDQCTIFSNSTFLEDIAGKKIDSNELAVKLRMVAVAFVASNCQAYECLKSCMANGGNVYKAQSLSDKELTEKFAGYLKEKIAENPDLARELFYKYIDKSDQERRFYNAIIDDLYAVFFEDYPKILQLLSRT